MLLLTGVYLRLNMKYNKNNLGLTLLETIVSVAILIVLITGGIYYYVEKTKKNKSRSIWCRSC